MPIDFTGIKTTGNRKYEDGLIAQINDSLQDIPIKQRAAILGSIIEESGGDPLARSENNTYQGLLQWGHDRYNILPMATKESELPRQIEYIRNTIHNTTDGKSWTHGGEGSGYSKGTEAHDGFNNSISPLDPSFRAFNYGYVRPKGKEASYKNRLKVAQQVYDRLHEEEKKKQSGVAAPDWDGMQFKPKSLFSNGGQLSAWNNLSMAEKAEMIGVAVRNGITSLPEIRAKYNEFAEGGKADTRYQHTEPDANLYAGGGYMEKAKAMIRANEGWRSKPYKDAPKGKNWRSVGYGFNDSGFWERYPEGISKHYENGITKAQAEKELDYFLGKAERQLKGIYGKRWNSFNDDQKAAILDTYYQRPASVGSKSGFYGAVMSGKDGAPYLGVQGFGDRNQSRRDLYRGRGISAPVSFESIAESVPDTDVTHFEPLNPQAFGMQLPTYQAPVIDTIDTTDKAATIDKTYDPAAIEKQERQDNLRRFGMFMSMLDGTSGQDSGMPDFINMLAGKPMTYGKGGHLYDGTTENSQQMQQGYIRQRPEGSYFYDVQGQPAIDVTPLNTSLSDNPADWTFTDASGKIYNPHRETVKGTGKLSEAVREGPLVSAANNYFRELNWRMQNDPSSIALKGKYTMPLILSPLLGQGAATALANPYVDAALTSGFGAHGLNHWLNEGVNGWGDAAMTALEVAPLGRLAKPMLNKAALAIENYRYPLGRLQIPENFLTIKPQVRTRVGDVEIDNPNLLYHLDRGDSAGAFSNRGAYVEDGRLLPGIAKEGEIPYSWWNLGRPFATSVNGQPMTRLMTTIKDTPGMLHVRSQNYPIGQWNGKRGLVRNTEYVNPEGINVSESTYALDPDYGWRRVFAEDTSTAKWADATKVPQITAENAASMTPEQWTAAQDAAIARGDMAEAQRLRDLHFEVNAPNTKISNTVYHGTDETFNQFDRNKIGTKTDYGVFGEGFYFSPTIEYARQYGDNVMPMYLNIENPYVGVDAGGILSSKYIPGNPEKAYQSAYEVMLRRGKSVEEASRIANKHKQNVIDWNRKAEEMRSKGYDGIFANTEQMNSHEHQFVAFNPEQIKSADAVTYDDNGVRIPLGERDNFNINDIRYGLFPLGIGLTGYGFNE